MVGNGEFNPHRIHSRNYLLRAILRNSLFMSWAFLHMTKSVGKENGLLFNFDQLNKDDYALIEAAISVLKANFHPIRHQVGSALRAASGKIYSCVNVYSIGYAVHAEAAALGAAISAGEREFVSIVAVKKIEENYPVVSPCGNCRQLINDYANQATVIFNFKGQTVKAKASDLLPGAYENSFTAGIRPGSLNVPE
jgi:cytidine deaminase